MVIEEVRTILPPSKSFRIRRIVSPLKGALKIWGNASPNIKPHNSGTPCANLQILVIHVRTNCPKPLKFL